MSKIDVRIFGVTERLFQIEKNKKILELPDNRIFMDCEHIGCAPTAFRTWSYSDEESQSATHIMVLSDDVELCEDFMSYCYRIIAAHPDKIISFFPLTLAKRSQVSRLPTKTPYVQVESCSGAAIMMPAQYVKPCLDFWDHKIRGDDTNITRWAKANNITILTTLPSIIQHLDCVSIFDPLRNLGGTEFFEPDPSYLNWDDDYYTPWTNIERW